MIARLTTTCIVSALLSAAATYWAVNPVASLNETQRAVLDEYLAVYCRGVANRSPDFITGAGAVLSRLTIKAGIGTVALAEYGKCRLRG
jgi:hypothetical protein